MFYACVVLSFCWSTPSICRSQNETPESSELSWKNGDRVPGYVVSADASRLHWQAQNLFRDPLNIDLAYLDQITFESDTRGDTKETYAIQTCDGFSLYGKITKLDDQFLHVSSSRCGDIAVHRSRIATILNLSTSGSLINGQFDLDKWDADRDEKKYWTVNDQGQLQSLRSNVHLFLKSELPESVLIEIELQWDKKLDFIFGFGVPRNSRNIESLPRLESWDDSIVLSYNDDFEIVQESVDSDAKRLKFLIHWNRTTNQIVIHDQQGKPLATADLGKPSGRIEPGIFIENKSGDLRVSALMIRRSAAGFDATQPSIQKLDEEAINGQIQSFDGKDWIVTTTDDSEPGLTIPIDKFCGASLINPALERRTGQTRLKFRDGMYIGGDLVSIRNGEVKLKTEFSAEPITLKIAGASNLRFETTPTKTTTETFAHRLFSNAGPIQGQLERGSGEADDILRWRVAGAESAVPFSQGDSRIVLQEKQPIVAVTDQWPDTLYLANRDTIPCRIISIDENHLRIDSFAEHKLIDQQLVKAVGFRNDSVGQRIAPSDDEWVIPKQYENRIKRSDKNMEVSKEAEFGHPWLLFSGGFEFDLLWSNSQYGVLECQTMVSDLTSGEGGKKLNIMLYGENLFVCNAGASDPETGMMSIPEGKASIAIQFEQGKLVVTVNGRQAYSEAVTSSTNRGCGVRFKLSDSYRQGVRCTLSNFKLKFLDKGNYSLVDPQEKQLLLTIPRLKKRNPPKHILCATNTDMLRGELVSLDEQFIMFRTNNEVKRFPRSIATSIVWLHAENLAKDRSNDDPGDARYGQTIIETGDMHLEQETLPAQKSEDRLTVQILMQGGRRMTTTLNAWTDDHLNGVSSVLGNCQIPIEQIYELRFGSFATRAMDVPFADWVAILAPAPKLQTGPTGERESEYVFGSASPLIGTTPQSFTALMLDGSEFSLKGQLGKVVVLDFWATWCGPCVQGLPLISETMTTYSPDQVTFIAVNQEEPAEKIKAFLESRQLNPPVALDSGKIGKQFQVESLPQTVIIDQAGNIAFVKIGNSINLQEEMKAAIDQLLAAPATKTAEHPKPDY